MKDIYINNISQYDLLSYFQSTLRTMSGYIVVSFAALVYSRFYRQKDNKSKLHNISMILISGIFNFIVHQIGTYLLNDIDMIMHDKNAEEKYYFIRKWLDIVRLLIYVNYGIFMLLVVTLVNEIRE